MVFKADQKSFQMNINILHTQLSFVINYNINEISLIYEQHVAFKPISFTPLMYSKLGDQLDSAVVKHQH